MDVNPTPIAGLFVLTPRVFGDARGFFMEGYNARMLAEAGITTLFVQDNHARSSRPGVLRGMHYQAPPHAQTKLVWVSRGAVLDVVVDIRVGSPTYGQHYAHRLDDADHARLLIPPGMAHGYITLTDVVDFQYKVDAGYAPESEGGLAWNDPAVGIDWGLAPGATPILSDKDTRLPTLAELDSPFVFGDAP